MGLQLIGFVGVESLAVSVMYAAAVRGFTRYGDLNKVPDRCSHSVGTSNAEIELLNLKLAFSSRENTA